MVQARPVIDMTPPPSGAANASPLTREPDRHGVAQGVSMGGFHQIAYADWGPAEAEVPVLCLHGLTRAHMLNADATGPSVPAIIGNAEDANHHRLWAIGSHR